MIDPLTLGIGAVLWLALRKQSKTSYGVMTQERAEIYNNALQFLHDPLRLRALADEFQREGLKIEAAMLRKRGEWRGRDPGQRAAHDEIFTKALASTNPQAILSVALAFEQLTATQKANTLRERAKALMSEERAKVVTEKSAEKARHESAESIPRNTDGKLTVIRGGENAS